MTSATLGANTSPVEVTNVSPHGFWLMLRDEKMFVSFEQFPWFKNAPMGIPQATISAIENVRVNLGVEHLSSIRMKA